MPNTQTQAARVSAASFQQAEAVKRVAAILDALPIVKWQKDAADGAAGNATAEQTIYQALAPITLSGAEIEPSAALTADNANKATFILSRRNSDGTGKVTILSWDTSVANGNWVAFATKLTAALANQTLAAGQKITLEITKQGTGVVVPLMALIIK